MIKLSPREKELFDFIRAHLKAHGFPPSFEEMCVALKLKSKSNISPFVEGLVSKGYIRRLPFRARGIEIIDAEDYCSPDCGCDTCCRARYLRQIKLIHALKVEPPIALLMHVADNFIPLRESTRSALLGVDTRGAAVRHQRPTALPSGAR